MLLADAGYYSEANVRQAGSAGPELLLATRSDRNRRVGAAPPRGRIPAGLSVRERMDRKLATQRGRRLYEQRRWMIEPVFGDVKEKPRHPPVHAARDRLVRQRMEADRRHPQPQEALSPGAAVLLASERQTPGKRGWSAAVAAA